MGRHGAKSVHGIVNRSFWGSSGSTSPPSSIHCGTRGKMDGISGSLDTVMVSSCPYRFHPFVGPQVRTLVRLSNRYPRLEASKNTVRPKGKPPRVTSQPASPLDPLVPLVVGNFSRAADAEIQAPGHARDVTWSRCPWG